jgi:hypothetical protein
MTEAFAFVLGALAVCILWAAKTLYINHVPSKFTLSIRRKLHIKTTAQYAAEIASFEAYETTRMRLERETHAAESQVDEKLNASVIPMPVQEAA